MRFTPILLVVACGSKSSEPAKDKPAEPPPPAAKPPAPTPPAPPPAPYSVSTAALPGAAAEGVFMDYLLYNPRTKTVWVPAGNTGSVDVVDAGGKISRIEGFPTKEMERNGKKRIVGPSSATLGPDSTVYVGNRGDFTVCAIDEAKLAKGTCGKLDSMPDGISYVAKTGEVWVTTPRDKSIRVLDAKTLAEKAKLSFEGEPEGFAPDNTRGRFYTNLEDKDETLAIDLATHKTVATWKPNCGEQGPHGLRLDEQAGFLFIACSTKSETMDVGHDGAIVGSVDTGDGVDDLDYASHTLYIGAAKDAKLTIAAVDAKGALTQTATVPTKDGARNGVVDAQGRVYLSHSKGGELVVVTPTR